MSSGPSCGSPWPARPLQVVAACRAQDLPILEITARKLAETVAVKSLHVLTRNQDCALVERVLGDGIEVIPEDTFIPGMTIEALRKLPVKGFPKAAGWYFQQFLKLQFAFVNPDDDHYLIWDADTVPLRHMEFFDKHGRMLFTKAEEYHAPYFDTYRRLLGEEPNREFSFISQHIIVQKSIAREMIAHIERHVSGEESWAWKIAKTLSARGWNLFSEYETYGHYLKNHYPDRVRFIDRSWLREGRRASRGGIPDEPLLAQLAEKYDFVAFEQVERRAWRRIARRLKSQLGRLVAGS